jgi:hypothetical protein
VTVPWAATHLDRRPSSISDVATDSLGLYVAPPVSHLELAARVPGYAAGDLESLMAERRLVGLRCLRGSAFLMPVDLLPVVVPATRDRNVRAFDRYLERSLTTATYDEWAMRVDDVLGDRMMTKAEIATALDPPPADRPYMSNVISQMATETRLIGVRQPVSWRSASVAYTRWENWLPGVDVHSPDPDEARSVLAGWYFERFGPATLDDFAWWSGLTKTQSRIAVEDAGLTETDGRYGSGRVGDPPPGVRLLPIWDTLFVTWKDRSRFIPDDLLPFVYDASGNATSVVLLDGVVAGVWGMVQEGDAIELRAAPFGSFTRTQWKAVEEEAAVVAGLAGATSLSAIQVSDPPDLLRAPRNRFMRPV